MSWSFWHYFEVFFVLFVLDVSMYPLYGSILDSGCALKL